MPKTAKRENWGKENKTLPELNLTKIQIDSYQEFLKNGIRQSLEELNPVKDFTSKFFQLELFDHHLGKPKLTPKEAMEKGVNFEAPLKVTAKLTNLQTKAVQEQEIFLGDIPLMTSVPKSAPCSAVPGLNLLLAATTIFPLGSTAIAKFPPPLSFAL
ncbi:hypothetical protein HYS10_01900 [Candidatus Collierbacteria bacterium]|nr:hypothetical protein [Candidatus Collierbacteria bacterium]